ncbi:MAG TPA: transglycosylase domain-containing protein [Microlunatus sp.]
MAEPRTGHSAQQRKTAKKRSWPKRIALALVVVLLVGVLGAAGLAIYGYTSTQRPNANADFQTATTFVYYNNGKSQLGSFAVQNRQPLTFEEIPQNVKDGVVAAENREFWTDQGVSIRGMFRAAWVILRGGELQGGSTITQQYIKIMYLNSEQTVTRKFRELFLAYKINKEMSKEEILTDYLNTIYFGRGAYGIQAASKAFFNVDAEDLTTQQAAVLISVINNPSLFDPGVDEANIPRLQERYSYVLSSMAETGAITQAEAAEYAAALPEFPEVKINERYGGPKGFLLKMVEKELVSAGFEPSQISGGGLKITTTFDKADQNAAVKAAQRYTKEAADARNQKASQLHAAVASVEVGTGEVLAIYGGPDYVKNSRNWATTARPTASTFKTYALAAGLKDEFSLDSRFNGNSFTPEGDSTPVRNEFSYQYGAGVTLLKAATDSINTAFVDMTTQLEDGPQQVVDMAEAVGAPKGAGWDLNSRIALGTAEVSPLNQANAYATFANDGTYVAPHVVKEVTDANGRVLYKANPEEKKAVSEDISRDVTYALSNVVEQGTGSTVRTLARPVAGKTGTKDVEDDITAAWFVAYTPQISTAVMYVAGDDGNADLDDFARPGDSTFFGGTYPALTWVDYMQTAVEDLPIKQFEEPAYVNRDSAPRPTATSRPDPTRTTEPTTEAPTQGPTEGPTQGPTTEGPTTAAPTQGPTTETPTEKPTGEPSGGG